MKMPIEWVQPSLIAELEDLEDLTLGTSMLAERKARILRGLARAREICEAMDDGDAAEGTGR